MPVAATIKVAVCPAVTDWLAGCALIASAVMPVPLRETPRGEFVASLETAMLPFTVPAPCGANWTWNAWFCPAAIETEDIPPTTLKPAPVIVACEIVTVAVPVFVSVSVWEPVAPAAMFPNVRLVALAARDPEAVLELAFVVDVPALVRPAQPETDKAVRSARIIVSEGSGVRRFRGRLPRTIRLLCEIMRRTV